MVDKRRTIITDRQFMSIILGEILAKGEVMESDIYPLVGSKSRVRPMLEDLSRHGILSIREKDHGHRAKLYSYTEKGMLFCLVNRFSEELLTTEGSLDLNTGEYAELYDGLRRHFGVEYGEDPGDGPRD